MEAECGCWKNARVPDSWNCDVEALSTAPVSDPELLKGGGVRNVGQISGRHRTPLHRCVFVNTVHDCHLREALGTNLFKAKGSAVAPLWIRHWTAPSYSEEPTFQHLLTLTT